MVQLPSSQHSDRRQWIRTLYSWGSAPGFYRIAARTRPWLMVLGLLLLLLGWVWGLVWAPEDYRQGDSVRIIYIHVPAVSMAMLLYLALAACAVVTLVWRTKISAIVASAIAPVGAWITVLALGSGAIWGRPTWGAYWVWGDPRLLSTLLLLLLYVGYIALASSFSRPERGERLAAMLALVGSINLPVIRYSVEWWNSLHQSSTFSVTSAPAMDTSMWLPLLPSFAGLLCICGVGVLWRAQALLLWRESNATWVKKELQSV